MVSCSHMHLHCVNSHSHTHFTGTSDEASNTDSNLVISLPSSGASIKCQAVCELQGSGQEMAQWVNTLGANTDGLGSTPRTHMAGENPFLKVVS